MRVKTASVIDRREMSDITPTSAPMIAQLIQKSVGESMTVHTLQSLEQ
jgi:hypothetical protein